MNLDVAQFTCRGGREINEDSLICGKDYFVVADGLGGHSAGEIASAAAVRSFAENCHGGYTDESINMLLEQANSAVLSLKSDARTTVAAAFVENGVFRYINAGDSRIYYFRNNRLFAHSRDHSVCQVAVDMGTMTFEEIRGSEDRSKLLKVLGDNEKLNIKKFYQPIQIENGDAFLICSDGFWDFVTEGEMEADLLKAENAQAWLRFMLKRQLLRAKNEDDNYTAVSGIFGGEEAAVIPVKKSKAPYIALCAAALVLVAGAAVWAVGAARMNGGNPEVTTTSVSEETAPEITEESSSATEETEVFVVTEITASDTEETTTEVTEEAVKGESSGSDAIHVTVNTTIGFSSEEDNSVTE